MRYLFAISFFLYTFAALGAGGDLAPKIPCDSLSSVEIPNTKLTRSLEIADKPGLALFCQVEGVIIDRVGFIMRFPVAGWNGKFAVTGCGGFCGALRPEKPGYSNSMNESLKLGYAVIQTDGGHKGESWDTDWAIGDPQALDLYGGTWMPLAVAAGKALVVSYYEDSPKRTYFSGCSNGGRLGMFAAQRYPDLFDGIAAGAGIFDLTGNAGVHGLWKLQSTLDKHGRSVIDRNKLPLLTAHVMQQCDKLDGVEDGVVSRPSLCEPDLESLRCTDSVTQECFTGEEHNAIARLYQGATVNGEQIFAGVPPGSESLWSFWLVGEKAWGSRASMGNLRLTYGIPTDQAFNPHDYDLAQELDNLQRYAPVLNATDPDLSDLAAQGGKLFYYHGLADPLILEGRVREYHAESVAVLGEQELGQTARFFMVPGQGHCWEKPGQVADDFNPLVIIDRWVESGEAPDYVIAKLVNDSSAIERSRKLCPYPQVAEFHGGDPDKAENFSCK